MVFCRALLQMLRSSAYVHKRIHLLLSLNTMDLARTTHRLAMVVLFCASIGFAAQAQTSRINIGALVERDTTIVGATAATVAQMAVEDINNCSSILNSTTLYLKVVDGQQNAVTGAFAVADLIKNETVAIVGPQTSATAEIIATVAGAAHVPVVTFAVSNPTLTLHRFPYFMRLSQSDTLQMTALADVVKNFRWKQVVVLYVDDELGIGSLPVLADALRDSACKIVGRIPFHPQMNSTSLQVALKQLRFLETRVFIVIMRPDQGISLLLEVKKLGLMSSEQAWIFTESFAGGFESLNPSILDSMTGVLGIRASLPRTPALRMFYERWLSRFQSQIPATVQNPLGTRAIAVYEAMWAVAYAIDALQKEGTLSLNFSEPISDVDITNRIFGIKRFAQGELLKQKILSVNFTGLGTSVSFNGNGEPSNCIYDIINFVGEEGSTSKVVGSWTLTSGLQINSDMIVWPGGSKGQVPRGFRIPLEGKRLKIAVPYQKGYTKFVSVTEDRNSRSPSHKYNVTGFCVEVFEAAVSALGFELPREYIPYVKENAAFDYYDDIIQQIYLKNFDAAVGPFAALADRSNYVDFTQPYSETGMVMTVPYDSGQDTNDLFTFVKPFSVQLWLASWIAFLLFAVVIAGMNRLLGHDTASAPSAVSKGIWMAFSLLFFMHRSEDARTPMARSMMVIWMVMALVLVSSYQASFSSLLTARQLSPKAMSLQDVLSRNQSVGYHYGGFIGKYLERQEGVPKKLLMGLNSVDEYKACLDNGTVVAIFDSEASTKNIFLATTCNKYTSVGMPWPTAGYTFVLPKGSPLLPALSAAVLRVTESPHMETLRRKWFPSLPCSRVSNMAASTSNTIQLRCFYFLFSFTASVTVGGLLYRLCCRRRCQKLKQPLAEAPTPVPPAGASKADTDVQVVFPHNL